MKRIILLIVICFPLLLTAQNRKWWIYPSLGFDLGGTIPFPLSDIPDGAKASPKFNLCFGLGFEYPVTGKWDFVMEAGYHKLAFSGRADVRSQSFYFDNQNILYFTGHTSTDVEISFLEFPVMAIYKLNNRASVLLGGYYSRILNGSFNTKGTDGVLSPDKNITDAAQMPGPANTVYDFNDYLDNWDTGLLIGYRHTVKHRIYVWSNIKVGLKSIFVREFYNIDYDMYQVRLNAGVSFTFFNKET